MGDLEKTGPMSTFQQLAMELIATSTPSNNDGSYEYYLNPYFFIKLLGEIMKRVL
uniref:Site-specific DNA-methyltransferase (adenine-specific) n=1 Tax=Heterorhabditis bacteriophora TaxID=37862 RepID=A0A1I7WRN4_HETBA